MPAPKYQSLTDQFFLFSIFSLFFCAAGGTLLPPIANNGRGGICFSSERAGERGGPLSPPLPTPPSTPFSLFSPSPPLPSFPPLLFPNKVQVTFPYPPFRTLSCAGPENICPECALPHPHSPPYLLGRMGGAAARDTRSEFMGEKEPLGSPVGAQSSKN